VAVRELSLRFLYVTELLVNKVYLEWEYDQDFGTILNDFNITVQKSKVKDIDDAYSDISVTATADTFYDYTDPSVDLLSEWENIYYRLKVQKGSSVFYTTPSTFFAKPDFILMEIRRRNDLLLRDFITPKNRWCGPNAAIYIRKQDGTRCTDCYDDVLEKRRILDCDTCRGTGWIGGYFGPIFRPVNFSPKQPQNHITEYGLDENENSQAWMGFDPILKPRDLVIEINTNQRWRVVQSPRTEKLRRVAHQNLVLYKIGRDDPEYKIDVPAISGKVEYEEYLPNDVADNTIYYVENDGKFSNPNDPAFGNKGYHKFSLSSWNLLTV